MQTAFRIFQLLPANGGDFKAGFSKIAVKLPSSKDLPEGGDGTGFMEIMSEFMAMPTEQVKASFKGLDWMPLDIRDPQAEMDLIEFRDLEAVQKYSLLEAADPQSANGMGAALPLIDLNVPDEEKGKVMDWLLSAIQEPAKEIPAVTKTADQLSSYGNAANQASNSGAAEPTSFSKDVLWGDVAAHESPSDEKTPSAPNLNPDLNIATNRPDSESTNPKVDASGALHARVFNRMPFAAPDSVGSRQNSLNSAPQSHEDASLEETAKMGKPAQFQSAPVETEQHAQVPPELRAVRHHSVENGSKQQIQDPTAAQKIATSSQSSGGGRSSSDDSTDYKRDPSAAAFNPADTAVLEDQGSEEVFDVKQADIQAGENLQEAASGRLRSTIAKGEGVGTHPREDTASLPKETQGDVIRQIVQRMTLRQNSGQSTMQIKLKPEFLGDLHLHVTTENHQVMVRMTAESAAVRDMVEQNLQLLKTELQHHGLQIDKFDVYVGHDNDAWKQRQQHQTSRQAHRNRIRRLQQVAGNASEEAGGTTAAQPLPGRSASHLNEVDFFA